MTKEDRSPEVESPMYLDKNGQWKVKIQCEQKLREKITVLILAHGDARLATSITGESPPTYTEPSEVTDQILALVEEWLKDAGWVNIRKGDVYWTREQLSAPDPAKDFYKE